MHRQVFMLPAILAVLLLACVLPELYLRLMPYPELVRGRLIQNYAFWPGLLHGWRPNYTGQAWIMFLSYGFLHAGLMHLVFNMATLISLGRPLIDELGQKRFALLYLAGLIGGGLGYGLLTRQSAPMVGASGALFGLAGALVWMRFRSDRGRMSIPRALRDITRPLLLLIGLNVVMYIALEGQLAWETHLGGFLAGAGAMAALSRETRNAP